MASRPNDQFGIGWYYIDVKNPSLSLASVTRELLRDEQGFEAYYNFAVTPWALLTPDIQIVHPAQKNTIDSTGSGLSKRRINTATVLGLRLQLLF